MKDGTCYNDSPEASEDASRALLTRGTEIVTRCLDGDYPLMNAIWNNLGFHVATVKLQEAGVTIPIGPHAQAYIGLLLACVEHVQAQRLLESALSQALE